MTREIKFRAWDNDMREMHSVSAIYFEANSSLMGKGPYLIDGHNDLHSLDDITVMQYTGLKDRLGVEIYEGDVVHYLYQPGPGMWNHDEIVTIEWKSTGFYLRPAEGNGGTHSWLVAMPGLGASPEPNDLLTVLGNIYEHPHLLAKEAA
jgi:uncharacterized phage protein (TIGR01671 family)